MSRINVNRGRYLQAANPAYLTPVEDADPSDYEVNLEFQLYDDMGRPQSNSYEGVGQIVRREGGKNALIIGDPYKYEAIFEYRMDSEPTAESLAAFERTRLGVLDAIDKRRKRKDADYDYLRGYEGAKRALKAARGRSR